MMAVAMLQGPGAVVAEVLDEDDGHDRDMPKSWQQHQYKEQSSHGNTG